LKRAFDKKLPSIPDFTMEDVYACLQCGYCRNTCPVFQSSGWESYSPRGKVFWLKQIMERSWLDRLLKRKIEPSEKWMKSMFCTLCGRCDTVCHVDIQFHRFWEEVHEWMAENGFGPPQGALDMRDSIFNEKFYNPFQEPVEKRTEWYWDDFQLPKKADIVYYIGCSTSYYEFKLLTNNLKILKAADVSFTTLGKDEWCCGAVNKMTGLTEGMEKIAKHNIDAINERGASKVVTSCPGCFRALYAYRDLIDFDFEILHMSQLFADLIHKGKLDLYRKLKDKFLPIVYHDPCELGRLPEMEIGKGFYEEPRFILESIPGVDEVLEFKTNKRDSECCGGGGGLKAIDFPLTQSIARRKVDQAVELNAKTIASMCPSCKTQLAVGAKELRNEAKEKGVKLKLDGQDISDLLVKAI